MRLIRRPSLLSTAAFAALSAGIVLLSIAPASAMSREEASLFAGSTTQPDTQALLYMRWIRDLTSRAMAGRDIGTPGGELARDYVLERFRSAGLNPAFDGSFLQELQVRTRVRVPATQPAAGSAARILPTTQPAMTVVTRTIATQNVVGILPGRGRLAREAIVIGGHYDHVGQSNRKDSDGNFIYFPGADDNASGVSGVMMLARWFASREPALGEQERRTLIFAGFTGEERGLHGSAWLASHLPPLPASIPATQPNEKFRVVAMLDLDMIGRLRNHRLLVFGVESGKQWREIVAEAAKGGTLECRMSGGGYGPSDHASFYARGVPVLFFITGGHMDVHQPSDTADKINAPGAIEVLSLVDGVARRLRVDPAVVAYVKNPPPTAAVSGNGAYLGIMPDPIGDGNGCVVSGIQADGPAAKAGIKAEDVIFGWNDKKIVDAGTLLAAIAAQKPGDPVKLQVRRAGKTIEFSVTLGRR